MTSALVLPPASEPVSLEAAKAHLRVDGEADDALISAAITAARLHVERGTRRVLIAQGWRIWRDAWPGSRVVLLPVAPLLSLDAVTVYDRDGEPVALPSSAYDVDLRAAPGRLRLAGGAPAPGPAINGIEIDVTAGYGMTAEDVPAPLRHAILMLVAHWYDNRSAVAHEHAAAVTPFAAAALIAPYRVLSL